MPKFVLQFAVDGSLFIEARGRPRAMVDFEPSPFGGVHVIVSRVDRDDPLGWQPPTFFDGTLEVAEAAEIDLGDADTLRMRLLEIRDGMARVAFDVPPEYEFHGDGIG